MDKYDKQEYAEKLEERILRLESLVNDLAGSISYLMTQVNKLKPYDIIKKYGRT